MIDSKMVLPCRPLITEQLGKRAYFISLPCSVNLITTVAMLSPKLAKTANEGSISLLWSLFSDISI